MSTPNHWHQIVVCYQATRVRYPKPKSGLIHHVKLMTLIMILRVKKTTSMTVSSSQTVWNATLEFLDYGIERKTGVILRCEPATHNEYMLKLSCVSLLQIFSDMFLRNIIWIGLQLEKLSQKWKGWTFYWDTVYMCGCSGSISERGAAGARTLSVRSHPWLERV